MAGLLLVLLMSGAAVLAPLLANDRPLVARVEGEWLFPALRSEAALRAAGHLSWEPPRVSFRVMPPIPWGPQSSDFAEMGSPPYPPSRRHWLGTDDRGRDILARMIWGARVSLSVGFVAVGIAILIGIVVGALAGYHGGRTDMVISRIIEIIMNIPTFFLIITIIAFLPPSIYNIMVTIGVTGWTGVARIVRGEFLRLREGDFVLAAQAMGASPARIMFRHILPNALAPVMVMAAFGISGAILTESGLSYLGFGVPPPTPSWGDIMSQAQSYISFAWWLATFPGLAIFLTVTGYNLIGQGLRDATDPRLAR
jgi:peptide/nickel transport system permease protein